MKPQKYLKISAIILALLVISLPIALADELNLQYDANGNLVTGDSFYREYNEFNQLSRIREGNVSNGHILEEFTWHPVEEKILIKDVFYNGIKNYSIYYVSDDFIRIENSSGNYTEKYIYQDGVLVAQANADGNKEFLHNDHEGSSTLITDLSGNVIENSFYSPFGEIIEGGKSSRYDFTGKEFDSINGEYDFHARRVNSAWGRFTTPDLTIPNIYNPQALNRYAYVYNNPYKYVDEDGDIPFLINIVAGVIVGALNTYEYYQTHSETNGVDAGLYFAAGFVEGFFGVTFSYGGAAAGGAVGQVIENFADAKPIGSNVIKSGAISGVTSFLGESKILGINGNKLLPYTPSHLIKNPTSYATTITGLKTIANIVTGEVASRLGEAYGTIIGQSVNANLAQSSTTSSSGGGGSSSRSSGISSFTSLTPQQTVKAAGGSTLSNAAQRAASENLAAKIIQKQREAAKKAAKKKRGKK